MHTHRANLSVQSLFFGSLIVFAAVFVSFASQAYARSKPPMTPLHSGLVSLTTAGQTVSLNVTLNQELVSSVDIVTLTLAFDVYEAPLIGIDGSSASVARIATHKSASVTCAPARRRFSNTRCRATTGASWSARRSAPVILI